MIFEKIIDLAFLPMYGLLGILPEIELSIDSDLFSNFFEIVRMAAYILPSKTIATIVILIIALQMFTISMALIRFIRMMVPFA